MGLQELGQLDRAHVLKILPLCIWFLWEETVLDIEEVLDELGE